MKQISLFDESDRLAELSAIGDPLEKLNGVVRWGAFEPMLNRVFQKERKGSGGRPTYPGVMMFKILVLLKDRMTFMRFLCLTINGQVPDAKTIWLFRENLTKAGVIKELFDGRISSNGLITRRRHSGKCHGESPKQRPCGNVENHRKGLHGPPLNGQTKGIE